MLPDACIDIVWDDADLGVAGPDTGPVSIVSDAVFVGIRFRPGAASGFLGVDAAALRDRTVMLAELWHRAAEELAERLFDRPQAASGLLQDALLQRAPLQPDPMVARVLDALCRPEDSGPRREPLTRTVDTSERSLRRHRLAAFGYGPNTLERILRLRRALRLARRGEPLVSVAQIVGYADQAQMNREFKRLAGCSPRRLAKQTAGLSANGVQ